MPVQYDGIESMIIEYDDGQFWLPSLHDALKTILPSDVTAALRREAPDGPWSAGKLLTSVADADDINNGIRDWLLSHQIAAYHGTRLDLEQQASIAKEGLRPLVPEERKAAISAFLSNHPRWPEVQHRLDDAIQFVGGGGAGSRSGQVHLTLSRSGLTRGFNHYLVEGSEFDHHVANFLLRDELHAQNKARGVPILYRVRLSGEDALAAANPFGEMAQPNLLNELMQSLAWYLATGDTGTANLEMDCGFILYRRVPPEEIIEAIFLTDEDLWEYYDHRLR